jgi:hypothetical protein
LIKLVSSEEQDKIVYEYYVFEKESQEWKPAPYFNMVVEIEGVLYTPINGRFEIPINPNFSVKPKLTDIHEKVNGILTDERTIFGMLMDIKGWW